MKSQLWTTHQEASPAKEMGCSELVAQIWFSNSCGFFAPTAELQAVCCEKVGVFEVGNSVEEIIKQLRYELLMLVHGFPLGCGAVFQTVGKKRFQNTTRKRFVSIRF
jgi:hypothetical protein